MSRIEKDDPPSVRLALGAEVVKTVGEKALGHPAVRLAYGDSPPERGGTSGLERQTKPAGRLACNTAFGSLSPDQMTKNLGKKENEPTGRLARKVNHQGDRTLEEGGDSLPALLVSYYYLDAFLENKHRYHFRDWAMDSGAFSAHNSGVEINLQDYINTCKKLIKSDPQLTEIFSLDVIGDYKASLVNLKKMWKQGVPAIPCFHYGEPWSLLKDLADEYPKVALGGCVGKRDKDKFAGQCFARIWPKKIHGFGFGSEKSIMLYPFHSVDATNWELAPCKFGQWKAFGGQRVSVRGSRQNLRAEVEWYLELERKARERWKKEMALLETLGPTLALVLAGSPRSPSGPTLRLAESGEAIASGERGEAKIQALSGKKRK